MIIDREIEKHCDNNSTRRSSKQIIHDLEALERSLFLSLSLSIYIYNNKQIHTQTA